MLVPLEFGAVGLFDHPLRLSRVEVGLGLRSAPRRLGLLRHGVREIESVDWVVVRRKRGRRVNASLFHLNYSHHRPRRSRLAPSHGGTPSRLVAYETVEAALVRAALVAVIVDVLIQLSTALSRPKQRVDRR